MTDEKEALPPRKTIVALHGAGMTGAIWGGIVPHLLDYSFRALTLPGHDARAGGEIIPDIAGMAAWVSGKIADDAEGSVILMGHSMGGLVALAAAKAKAVGGVVLMGTAAEMPVNNALLTAAHESPAEAAGMIAKWGTDPAHPQGGAVRTVLSTFMAETLPEAIGNDLTACNAFKEGKTLAETIHCPILVLSGAQDKMVSAAASTALADVLPQGDFRLLENCGHMMMLERPMEAANEIKPFIESLGIESLR